MIRSMTGYGKSVAEITGKKLTIEIKTLNSKQLDLNLKIPGYFRDKELEVRNFLTRKLDRGKVDLFITTESCADVLLFTINHDVAVKYYHELKNLRKEMKDDCSLLPLVLQMPEVMQGAREEISEKDWVIVLRAIEEAADQVDEYRLIEGRSLEEDMLRRVQLILQELDAIGPFEKSRIEEQRDRLERDFSRYLGDFNGAAPDQNRFEQELIYYFEKLDITEEKVRLLKHCQFFLETIGNQASQGKKLGFIIQEMGREINTIGSKACHAEIQKIVVRMKDELEKIKEQLGNIL